MHMVGESLSNRAMHEYGTLTHRCNQIRDHPRPSENIRGNQMQSDAIRCNQMQSDSRPSETIGGNHTL